MQHRPNLVRLLSATLVLALAGAAGARAQQAEYASQWDRRPDRLWIGAEYWANRLQDWRLRDGRAECVGTRLPRRTLHLLSHGVSAREGSLRMVVRTGVLQAPAEGSDALAFAGFLIGGGAADLDPRAAALVQSAPGPDGGWVAGIDAAGRLFVRDFADPDAVSQVHQGPATPVADVVLDLHALPAGDGTYTLTLEAYPPRSGRALGFLVVEGVPAASLVGGIALMAHPGPRERATTWWFRDFELLGDKLQERELRAGPILGAQYTVSRRVLKLTAQLMPVAAGAGETVRLELKLPGRNGAWAEAARAAVDADALTARFRIVDWPCAHAAPYRLLYRSDGTEQVFAGTIRSDPVGKDPLVLAALSCCHQNRFGFGNPGYPWNENALWFPHADTSTHVQAHAPDLLFFAGDQIYEGASPTYADKQDAPREDYLYKWYLWMWAFRDLLRDTPCVTIPDDHDVFQGNVWGAGGRKTDRDNKGGYVMSADWVRMVERTQTSHLPDPWFSGTVEQGIGTYFTELVWGGVSFAILEDRKFKSGPSGLVQHDGPRPDHVTNPDFDIDRADVPGAELLGPRQLRFLEEWAADWHDSELKCVLSQTVFANVATTHGPARDRLVADFDSNGWPQSGRDAALRAIRKAFAPHVCGDQHLSTLVQHGIDAWNDAPWSFCVPAIANFYLRAWEPQVAGANHVAGLPAYTGEYFDGFRNKVTVWAATNPDGSSGHEPAALHDPKPGYGVVRFHKRDRAYTFESWPRGADPATDAPFDGWPRTIPQRANDGRTPVAWLATLRILGLEQPEVAVFEADGVTLVYAMRLQAVGGEVEFRPWVFAEGEYQV
ncbi:MAG TPA: alkaline phosphatase D family protein, partial [Planctomycetota bacterium]